MNFRFTDLPYLSENFKEKVEGFICQVSLLKLKRKAKQDNNNNKKYNGIAMPLEDEEKTVLGCKGNFSSHLRNIYSLNIFVAA